MKVLAILIIILGLVVIIVPQFTNCEYGKEQPATLNMKTSGVAVEYASMGGMEAGAAEASVPYRMMKCFWSARAEIVAGVPLVALGALLFFARRKETIRVIGILTALIGVLTLLIPTSLIGTCAQSCDGVQHQDEAHAVRRRGHHHRARRRRAGARRADGAPRTVRPRPSQP